ncbi:hypothetical protein [Budvicia aquatica]|uniref:Uncharacterized protein n=1 Tax=Budvicia aquatica TaxID=82979 RepID=A0A2C6DIW8_9GAMM|nr:hypothetical protein [Budvicia aquatica]PHI31166.1 hypothetical protein CRN84_18385 [Budvicia aquatica]VFS51422.1 Uncharacterised protein [Budvicia aquatica]
MKLYIANCTHQSHFFNYRLPERLQPFFHAIPSGHQVMLDMPKDSVNFVIEQHELYGLCLASKINGKFSGLCYSIDKEMDVNAIQNGIDQKLENMEAQSQEIRENGVIAMNHVLDQAAIQNGEAPQAGLEVEIKGEPLDSTKGDAKTFTQKIKVGK